MTAVAFTKLHGAGNDYLFVDGFRAPLPGHLERLARRMSDRRFGVGSDGLILLAPAGSADFRMRVFNADGSEARMCGNGLRCAFKYLRDRGVIGDRATARTGAGTLQVEFVRRDGDTDVVRVDLGSPVPGDLALALDVEGARLTVACVDTGTPNAVVFVDQPLDIFPVERYGPALECHPHFPDRTNVEFVRCVGKNEAEQRTWERGSGETSACGTGASAAVVAGCLTGRLRSPVTVHLPGGDLGVAWDGEGSVFLEGPAEEVFSGQWPDRGEA